MKSILINKVYLSSNKIFTLSAFHMTCAEYKSEFAFQFLIYFTFNSASSGF